MADQKPAPALEGAGAAQEKAPVAKKKTALRTIVKDRKKGEQLEAIKRIEANLKEEKERREFEKGAQVRLKGMRKKRQSRASRASRASRGSRDSRDSRDSQSSESESDSEPEVVIPEAPKSKQDLREHLGLSSKASDARSEVVTKALEAQVELDREKRRFHDVEPSAKALMMASVAAARMKKKFEKLQTSKTSEDKDKLTKPKPRLTADPFVGSRIPGQLFSKGDAKSTEAGEESAEAASSMRAPSRASREMLALAKARRAPAKSEGIEFIEQENTGPMAGYFYRADGPQGPGYYLIPPPPRKPKKGEGEVLQCAKSWGQWAMFALTTNDANELKAALLSLDRHELKTCINLQVHGSWNFYYGNYRGRGSDEFAPFLGDTLLHMSIRFKRSKEFIGTLLFFSAQCGAKPREIRNSFDEVAGDIDIALLRLGEKHGETLRIQALLNRPGASAATEQKPDSRPGSRA